MATCAALGPKPFRQFPSLRILNHHCRSPGQAASLPCASPSIVFAVGSYPPTSRIPQHVSACDAYSERTILINVSTDTRWVAASVALNDLLTVGQRSPLLLAPLSAEQPRTSVARADGRNINSVRPSWLRKSVLAIPSFKSPGYARSTARPWRSTTSRSRSKTARFSG